MTIGPFRGAYGFLSNMWECRVDYQDIKFPSAEHAYQAARYESHMIRRRVAALRSPVEAKHFKRDNPQLLQDNHLFEPHKYWIMDEIVGNKFFRNKKLGESLLQTEPHELVETGWWHDNYWGVCTCGNKDGKHPRCAKPGENQLGKILMLVRRDLSNTSEEERWEDVYTPA